MLFRPEKQVRILDLESACCYTIYKLASMSSIAKQSIAWKVGTLCIECARHYETVPFLACSFTKATCKLRATMFTLVP